MGETYKQDILLVINAGSSSIKIDVYNAGQNYDTARLFKSELKGIGQTQGVLTFQMGSDATESVQVDVINHIDGLRYLLNLIDEHFVSNNVVAIGQRVVHGGNKYYSPTIVDDEMIGYLQSLTAIDSEHMPIALRIIDSISQTFETIPQIACFDTGFFHDLPKNAKLLTIGNYHEEELRRYGFHGLSYTYLRQAFGNIAGDEAMNGRVIYAHLGSGCSLAATKDGNPIDTTMGLTPSSGIMMSSRSGDIDPELPMYLNQRYGLSLEDFTLLTSKNSGLLGVSGMSADMKTLLDNEALNPKANDAVNLFVYQVKKTIGAYSAALGGLDSIVFSGGIGEQSAVIRQRVCEDLEFLGVVLDDQANQEHCSLISAQNSRVGVHVIPTDESSVIYKQTMELLNLRQEKQS